MIDDADRVGASGVHLVVAGQQHFLGMLGQHGPRQQHGDDARAEADLGLSEARPLGGDGDVAGEGHLESPGHAEAVHEGDRGLRAIPESHDEIELPFHLAADMVHGGHVAFRRGFHVEAGGEGAAFAAHQDCPDCIVGFEGTQRRPTLVHRVVVEGVQDLRPIESEGGERTVRLYLDVAVGHGSSWMVSEYGTRPQSRNSGLDLTDRLGLMGSNPCAGSIK
jgi:hypothetical protein